MEASVKAIGYGGLCRSNSVDVQNIAYHEQYACHIDHGLPYRKGGKLRLTWWKHAHNHAWLTRGFIQLERDQNGTLTALTFWLISAIVYLASRRQGSQFFVAYRRIEIF